MFLSMLNNLYSQYQSVIGSLIFFVLWQISLLEMPEYRRKKLMSLTTNLMRDDSEGAQEEILSLTIAI